MWKIINIVSLISSQNISKRELNQKSNTKFKSDNNYNIQFSRTEFSGVIYLIYIKIEIFKDKLSQNIINI